MLSTKYNILFNILVYRLTPYVDEITGDHQCRFRCNRSTTDQIFCTLQDTGDEAVHKPLTDFKKAYDTVRRNIIQQAILTELGILMKLGRLIKICSNETFIKVHTDEYLSDEFPIQNDMK
jgi:hypothetical protein